MEEQQIVDEDEKVKVVLPAESSSIFEADFPICQDHEDHQPPVNEDSPRENIIPALESKDP